jgi:tetratricopeptide (TPR) repeat protein
LESKDYLPLVGRGWARVFLKDYSNANKDFADSLKAPDDSKFAKNPYSSSWVGLSACKLRVRDIPGAITDLEEARKHVKTQIGFLNATVSLAYLLHTEGKDSSEMRSEALSLCPNIAQRELDNARIIYTVGDEPAIIFFCSRAIFFDPKLADAYYFRGLARKAIGEVELAEKDFAHVLSIDPNHQLTHDLMQQGEQSAVLSYSLNFSKLPLPPDPTLQEDPSALSLYWYHSEASNTKIVSGQVYRFRFDEGLHSPNDKLPRISKPPKPSDCCSTKEAVKKVGQSLGLPWFSELVSVAEKMCASWSFEKKGALSWDSMLMLCIYTFEWSGKASHDQFYSLLSRALRNQDPKDVEVWNPVLYYFLTALEELPDCDGYVYQGVNKPLHLDKYQNGQSVVCVQ